MARFGEPTKFKKSNNPKLYTTLRSIGSTPPAPGIYECQECGFEDVINRDCDRLPPCSYCRSEGHDWKLIARAVDAIDKNNKPYP